MWSPGSASEATQVTDAWRRIKTMASIFSKREGVSGTEIFWITGCIFLIIKKMIKKSWRATISWCTLTSAAQLWPLHLSLGKPNSILSPNRCSLFSKPAKTLAGGGAAPIMSHRKEVLHMRRQKRNAFAGTLAKSKKLTSILKSLFGFPSCLQNSLDESWPWKAQENVSLTT